MWSIVWPVKWTCLYISKLQQLHRWCSIMDHQFNPTIHIGCNYLSMLGLKSIHVSKRGPIYRVWPQFVHHCDFGCSVTAGLSAGSVLDTKMIRSTFPWVAATILSYIYLMMSCKKTSGKFQTRTTPPDLRSVYTHAKIQHNRNYLILIVHWIEVTATPEPTEWKWVSLLVTFAFRSS